MRREREKREGGNEERWRAGESGFLKERSWGDVDSLAMKFQVGRFLLFFFYFPYHGERIPSFS